MTTPDRFSLDGRTVLVTGAAGGIGRAVVRGAVELGARVVASDRVAPEAAAFELHDAAAAQLTTSALDLANVMAITEQLHRIGEHTGGLDAVIHAAGLLRRAPSIDTVTEADWDAQHDVNLKAAFFLVRESARIMPRGGSVVLFTSQGWWTGGLGGSIAYNAAKGGVVSLLRGFSRELAPRGIRVNGIAPGFVDTAMMSEGLSDEDRRRFAAQVPLGRMAEPAEVADPALFLISDAARYLTGATLNVSGGQLIY